jgi:23S rRNA (cytidine2498-2'-O)-methyltransferase
VESDLVPLLQPSFGRMGFWVLDAIEGPPDAQRIAAHFERVARDRVIHVQGWTPDTARSNPLSAQAQALQDAVAVALPSSAAARSAQRARDRGGLLGQLCVIEPGLTVVGVVAAVEAVSLAPGGRARMSRDPGAPSRAAGKLEEALEAMGVAPVGGETCVDLGAAPGGWTQRLVSRGAQVIAVDPANLAPALRSHSKVRHVKQSAFSFEPEEPIDWLVCDMAWRPLEVAQLLAKWGRRGWALYLVANIKLPMRDKNGLLHRVRHVLSVDGQWRHLTVRQLYHDRDEVTVTARRT